MLLPDGWKLTGRAPGYGYFCWLRHERCGWTSEQPVDLVVTETTARAVIEAHTCPPRPRRSPTGPRLIVHGHACPGERLGSSRGRSGERTA